MACEDHSSGFAPVIEHSNPCSSLGKKGSMLNEA